MREWRMEDIQERIAERGQQVNRDIIRNRQSKAVRRRPRHEDEQRILDILCKLRWEKACAEGKVKIMNSREWYYEFD